MLNSKNNDVLLLVSNNVTSNYHMIGKQIVQSVVKQEELKLLKTRDGAKEAMKQDNTISDLPDLVRDALVGM